MEVDGALLLCVPSSLCVDEERAQVHECAKQMLCPSAASPALLH